MLPYRLDTGLLTFILMGVLGACAGPKPYEEHALAYVALRSAESAQASRYSPGNWSKAERMYREGRQLYKENSNEKSRVYFLKSIKYSEKAENVTRLKKFQSGGVP